MSELSFGERDRCGLYTLLENDIVQFAIAKDKRDGMTRATQISLLDQSFLKSKEQRHKGTVIKLDNVAGGQIQCTSADQPVSFRFTEVMKDKFQICEGDSLEFTLVHGSNNGVCFVIIITPCVLYYECLSKTRIRARRFESNCGPKMAC